MKIKYLTSLILIAVNMYPLYGIYFLGWELKNLILLYYFETLVIFIYTLLKINFLKKKKQLDSFSKIVFWFSSFLNFIISFGLITTFYFPTRSLIISSISYTAIFLMIGSHGISFLKNFIYDKEYLTSNYSKVVGSYVSRAISLYLLAIFSFENEGLNFMILLILCKTFYDVLVHNYEHSSPQTVIKN